jgi:hypothetical protein
MRQTFYFLLAVLILRMFFPDVAQKLEVAASAFLDLADALLANAAAHAGSGGSLF